ncbi:hypothetical protein AgCh_030734 [Apium graveolens]
MKGGKEEADSSNKDSKKRKRGNKSHKEETKKKKKPSSTSVSRTQKKISNVGNSTKSLSFLDKMKARLSGGHFRMINEKLYTCSGEEALSYFKEDPSLFNMYHVGYQEQMAQWPEQPVSIIIQWLKDHSPSLVVADFGCGDARLSRSVKNKVFSFDLVAHNSSVVACDMANTPLENSSIDVAVFCLSLMGTNFPSYLREAERVLKQRSKEQI